MSKKIGFLIEVLVSDSAGLLSYYVLASYISQNHSNLLPHYLILVGLPILITLFAVMDVRCYKKNRYAEGG
jgi:uncharacterized membrane protein